MAKKKITDLKFDDKNFNIGSQQGNALLEKSIQKFGFREAATVDKNGVLIGGNKRTAKAGELGFEDVEIIKADPKKVYALQYDDIDIDTPEGRSLALALNATAKSNIVLDAELVEAELGEAVCEEWGAKPNYSLGHDINSMTDEDVDLEEEFDPIGNAKDLHKIVFIFDSEDEASNFMLKNLPALEFKRFNGGSGKIYQVNLSKTYGKK